MSWNANEEKLLCLMVLNDDLADKLSCIAGPAFFRAFIVQNRKTGKIIAKMRWNYITKGKSWTYLEPKEQGQPEQLSEHLRCSIQDILTTAASVIGNLSQKETEDAIHCFYPPDDGGDPGKVIIWLEQQDLVEIVGVERIEPEGEN